MGNTTLKIPLRNKLVFNKTYAMEKFKRVLSNNMDLD